MNKTSIEWCTRSWNPVTGCRHICRYCYARRMAHRWAGYLDLEMEPEEIEAEAVKQIHVLDESKVKPGSDCEMHKAPFPFDFEPTFHRYRLGEPAAEKRPQNIFTVDMGDLFGEWVPDGWIREVFAACEVAPWHNYLFLTKAPWRLAKLFYDGMLLDQPNIFYGTTDEGGKRPLFMNNHRLGGRYSNFVSVEPLQSPMSDFNLRHIEFMQWVIVGAETGNRKDKITPRREWVEAIVKQCRAAGVPVFLKNNLAGVWGEPLIQEYPELLRAVAERGKSQLRSITSSPDKVGSNGTQ